MTLPADAPFDFDLSLKSILPRLRIYARSLTRDLDRADDLVQRTAVSALVGRRTFRPGTNFPGWMFRIQRNEFISGLRRERRILPLDAAPVLSVPPLQESPQKIREFVSVFRQLPKDSRRALVLAQLEGHSYERIALNEGISVGTVKSRISRARASLRKKLDRSVDA